MNQNIGDIIIYRIYWYKRFNKDYLKFPGLNYIGQTRKSLYNRVLGNGGHFYKAFNNPSTSIEYSIRKYGGNNDSAKKIINFKTIQIVKFQGDWNKIRKIKDLKRRHKIIKGSKDRTQILANKIEKFWIGSNHSQYYRFGRNILPGGKETRGYAALNFNKLDEVLEEAS